MSTYNPGTGGSYIETLAEDLLVKGLPEGDTPAEFIRDDQWIRQSFMIPTSEWFGQEEKVAMLDETDRLNRTFTSASIKYTNASLGGNFPINPPPQFTPYADIYDKGLRFDAGDVNLGPLVKDPGMGDYYAEAIDDNSQVIHIQPGVPQYNSLVQFFTGFYNSDAGTAARAGRLTDSFISKFLNFGANVVSAVIFPLVLIPAAVMMLGTATRYMMNWPTSKFATLKPTPALYWNAVTQLVNQLGSNMGIINYFKEDEETVGVIGQIQNPKVGLLSSFLPQQFTPNGRIDVFAVANRAKIMQERHESVVRERFQNGNTDYFGVIRDVYGTPGNLKSIPPPVDKPKSLESYLEQYLVIGNYSKATSGQETPVEKDIKYPEADDGSQTVADIMRGQSYRPSSAVDSFISYAIANLADGSDWASFRVDYTGSVTESFTNQTAPSALAQKLNSISAGARDVSNALSGGIIGEAASAVKQVMGNLLENFQLEGLIAVAGSAFVDIPDHWDSSQASINKSTYTMHLSSPYGNPVSQLFNIYIPLAMIMCLALPLATGKQSHTHPFAVKVFDKGRCITQFGYIDNLTITRGTSNLGFDRNGRAMAIDVSFSIKDLSSVVALPIQPGFSLNVAAGLFDSENSFSDYLMAMSAMDLRDVVYRLPMLKKLVNREIANLDAFFSSSHFASWIANVPGSDILRAVMRGTDRGS